MSKEDEIKTLIGNSYKIIKGYSGVNSKLNLVCNSCETPRNVLPKSFIKNPHCKGCQKKVINSVNYNKKITEMNVSLRRKAKRIGFKITEWFEEMPTFVNVSCRACNHSYYRAVNSLRNGLVCFNCKKNKESSGRVPSKIDLEDIPYLITYLNKEPKELPQAEAFFVKELKSILKSSNFIFDYYDKNKEVLIGVDKREFKIQKNYYTKKRSLGSLKEIIPNLINKLGKGLISSEKCSIKSIEETLSKSFFYKNLLRNYADAINSLDSSEIISFYNKITPKFSLIRVNQKNKLNNLILIDFKNKVPSKVKCNLKEDTLFIYFDNNLNFSLKISTRECRERVNQWNLLFQENWVLLP